MAVCQLTHSAENAWESPDFDRWASEDAHRVLYMLDYAKNNDTSNSNSESLALQGVGLSRGGGGHALSPAPGATPTNL